MAKLTRVLIMAGGTGGHVFPGLAVAKQLRQQGVIVNWLGTHKGLEAKLVPEAGIPINFIHISGFRGKRLRDKLFVPWQIGMALIQSIRIIGQFKPDVVIGMGGFVSGPGGIASWLLGKKLVIHEQNAKPGSTNKWLAKIAHKVLEAFPNTFPVCHPREGGDPSQITSKITIRDYLKWVPAFAGMTHKKAGMTREKKGQAVAIRQCKIDTVGNPVRSEITSLPPPDKRFNHAEQAKHLLILGGSLGAQAINQLVPGALAKLAKTVRPVIWHQTGEKHLADTRKAYENAGVTANVVPFIVEMDKAYAWADVVLCRAGALTISELCAVGLGAILVPFPYAIDDHQTANANFMVKQHAALLVQQAALTEDKLVELLEGLCGSGEQCMAMAQAAYTLRKVDATEKIITVCKEICH